MDPPQVAQQALSRALALARETSTESVWGYGRGVYLAGLTALRRLQHDLAAAQGDGVAEYRALNMAPGDPFDGLGDELPFLLLLADRRASAARFVEQASAVLPVAASGHLMAAAAHYRASALEAEQAFGLYCGSRVQWQSALALLEQPGGDQSPAWQGFWASAEESLADRATRAQMAEHVARVVAAEAAAVEELEHTLESIRR
jgi:hypothetical protein